MSNESVARRSWSEVAERRLVIAGRERASFLVLAVVLLGLAVALPVAPGPAPEESTYLSMVKSLWHDHDLSFARADLGRGLERWSEGPRGVALLSRDAGTTSYFDRPLAYPLAVLPFYAVLGDRGLLIFNVLSWLAFAAALLVRRRFEEAPSLVWWLGFVVATAGLGYLFRAQAETFVMLSLFAALWLWHRGRSRPPARSNAGWRGRIGLSGAGLAIGMAAAHTPLAWIFAVAILVDLLAGRRLNSLVGFLSAVLLVTLALSSVERRLVEGVEGPTTLRARFHGDYPVSGLEARRRGSWERALQGIVLANAQAEGSRIDARSTGFDLDGLGGLRNAPRNLLYLFVGRHLGLLAFFPFALAALCVAVVSGGGDRQQRLLLAAVGVALLVIVWNGPPRDSVAVDTLGDPRLALIAPALWLVAGRRGSVSRRGNVSRRSKASGSLPWLAAALWTLPAVVVALPTSASKPPLATVLSGPKLPLEVTLAAAGRLPGYAARLWGEQALWLVPRATFFVDEGRANGVWLRGDSRSEVFVVSREPALDLSLDAHALGDGSVRLRSSGNSAAVRFDSLAKRQGSRLHLVARPMAQLPSPFTARGDERVYYYRIEVTVEGGKVGMMHDPASSDRRFLGVYFDFSGEGL